MSQFTCLCFTVQKKHGIKKFHNYWKSYDFTNGLVTYCCYQLESGSKSKRLHLQGYLQLRKRQRFGPTLFSNLPDASYRLARGSDSDNYKYCSKTDTRVKGPWFHGECRDHQGHRSDIEAIGQMVARGASNREIAESHPNWWRYTYMIDRARSWLIMDDPRPKPKVYVHLGPAGSGKTTAATQYYGDNYWICPPKLGDRVWFDGYVGQDVAIFDDINGSWMPRTTLLQILHEHTCKPDTKGARTNFIPKVIVLTTNHHPRDWYQYPDTVSWIALRRRINLIKIFENFSVIQCIDPNLNQFKNAV